MTVIPVVGKRSQPVHVVSIAVRLDHRSHRLGRDLRDFVQQHLPAGRGGLGVDHDHALIADDHAAVSAAALDPIDVGRQLVRRERRGGLPLRQSAQAGNGSNGQFFCESHTWGLLCAALREDRRQCVHARRIRRRLCRSGILFQAGSESLQFGGILLVRRRCLGLRDCRVQRGDLFAAPPRRCGSTGRHRRVPR